jgi:monoamine oxidase
MHPLKSNLLNKHVDSSSHTSSPLHIVILGAGLTGLCAAFELEKQGHTITILEADSDHIGGRVRTMHFEGSMYGELGAMRIPQNHKLTLDYVKQFNLSLRQFNNYNPEAYYYVRGRKERCKNFSNLNSLFRITPWEHAATADQLWEKAIFRLLDRLPTRTCIDLFAPLLLNKILRNLDQLSLQQIFNLAGFSQEAVQLIGSTYSITEHLDFAITQHLREELTGLFSQNFYEIVGGNDQLPKAFAKRLRSKPMLGCNVIGLKQNTLTGRTTAIYRQQGRLNFIEGDCILCTLPFPILKQLEVDPPFSAQKHRSIHELQYDSSTKVLAVTRKRFWEADDKIFGGGTHTDLPIGAVYYPSDNASSRDVSVSNNAGVILASYTFGQKARHLAKLPPEQREMFAIQQLAKIHPQLHQPAIVKSSVSWSWDKHPWSKGAFALHLPGQHTALYQNVIAPEGNIFFAGEHTSLANSWMQGAFESALRAVGQISTVTRLGFKAA